MNSDLQRLDWIKLFPGRLRDSEALAKMKDFQLGWYMRLLFIEMPVSERVGYLRNDGRLWTLAGSHSRQFFDKHSAVVLDRFKIRTFDDGEWIYNHTLLEVLTSQSDRLIRSRVVASKKLSYPQFPQGGGSSLSVVDVGVGVVSKKQGPKKQSQNPYRESDFIERDKRLAEQDLRKLCAKLTELRKSGVVGRSTAEDTFAMACLDVGITVARGENLIRGAVGGDPKPTPAPGPEP